MEKILSHTQSFSQALKKLKEAIALPESEIVRDGSIQRFEFTFELAWKLMKIILAFNGEIIGFYPGVNASL